MVFSQGHALNGWAKKTGLGVCQTRKYTVCSLLCTRTPETQQVAIGESRNISEFWNIEQGVFSLQKKSKKMENTTSVTVCSLI